MKFVLFFKTPDVLHYALDDTNMSEDEREKCKEFAEKWVDYGECASIEFDTEAGTATVQKV